jgi:hypothetical protein
MLQIQDVESKQIVAGNYNVYLVNANHDIKATSKVGWNINDIKTVQLKDIKFDGKNNSK